MERANWSAVLLAGAEQSFITIGASALWSSIVSRYKNADARSGARVVRDHFSPTQLMPYIPQIFNSLLLLIEGAEYTAFV